MGSHLAVHDDGQFIDVEKSEELKTRVESNDIADHDYEPSFGEETGVVVNCFASMVVNVAVFVKVLVLFSRILRVKM